MSTFQFRIQIKDIENPPVWRSLQVPDVISFNEFHEVIQFAFGWQNSHLYKFSPKGWRSTPAITLSEFQEPGELNSSVVMLSEIFTHLQQTYTYIYDFGDNWIHNIKLEKILKEEIQLPVCTGGRGTCPPEDCGGPSGYLNLQEALANPDHPQHNEMMEWLGFEEGDKWNADAFDINALNDEFNSWELNDE